MRCWQHRSSLTRAVNLAVRHETIDNEPRLVQRIVWSCRKAALSPYHYTPPEHHVDVPPKAQPIEEPSPTGKSVSREPNGRERGD
jgi:hypothetical protein